MIYINFNRTKLKKLSILTLFTAGLAACGATQPTKTGTLRDFDNTNSRTKNNQTAVAKPIRDEEKIRKAYSEYINLAPKGDPGRAQALTRLAYLELKKAQQITDEGLDFFDNKARYKQTLELAAEYLEERIYDYPNDRNTDKLLYQLAQVYDQLGFYSKTITSLETLTNNYPKSEYFSESVFRIGESYFAQGNYQQAQARYSQVINDQQSSNLKTKSYFKRGWSQYKLLNYTQALDDFMLAYRQTGFDDTQEISDANKSIFNEYMRAIALVYIQADANNSIEQQLSAYSFKNHAAVYETVGSQLLSFERYSDAIDVYNSFINKYPQSPYTPVFSQKRIDVLKKAKFKKQHEKALLAYIGKYQPKAEYWQTNPDYADKEVIIHAARDYALLLIKREQVRYQKQPSRANLNNVLTVYAQYFAGFENYARKDGVYAPYAELLLKANRNEEALSYFKRAAFDDELILDKEAAYASINLMAAGYTNAPTEEKAHTYLNVSERYLVLYPSTPRSIKLQTNTAALAFKLSRYDQAIRLTHKIAESTPSTDQYNLLNLRAQSFVATERYFEAENTFIEQLNYASTKTNKNATEKSLALAIYRQGEAESKANNIDKAIVHFQRIQQLAPSSELAETGLYDAIALSVQQERWGQSIALMDQFSNLFPKSTYNTELVKKRSVAYMNTDQSGMAAKAFEQMASTENDIESQRIALWQAAKLYKKENNSLDAIRAYKRYVKEFKQPFDANIEAMYTLAALYDAQGQFSKQVYWEKEIITQHRNAVAAMQTPRTQTIHAQIVLNQANREYARFSKIKLVNPIKRSLKRKKTSMQSAVSQFGDAAATGIDVITTEATFKIAQIYDQFSLDLLDSERPTNLSDDESEQYEILLEDQAYPFEEKAIEFYETNLSRTQEMDYDRWLEKSMEALQTLFPVRYGRKPKVSHYSSKSL